MGISRRNFLKATGVFTAGATLGLNLKPAKAKAAELKIAKAKETKTICPYCAVGCGMLVHSIPHTNKVINLEGDPDHVINRGALCAKGASLRQLAGSENPRRITKPLYRAPGASEWQEVSWEWAIEQIAKRVKETRDRTFVVKNEKGNVVNRCEGIASLGSASLDNEECYLLVKMLRILGVVYLEHQARI